MEHTREGYQSIIHTSLYVPPYLGYRDLVKLTKKVIQEIDQLDQRVLLISNKEDLNKEFNLGIVLGIESARLITRHEDQLEELFSLGVRGVIPVHFIDNHLGNSCDDPRRRSGLRSHDDGVTSAGRDFARHLNRLGMWVDLTHTTEQTGTDFLELCERVIISHVGVRDLRPLQRNKPIQFLKSIAEKGGLIGLSPWLHLIGSQSIIDHIKFCQEQGLGENICFGSDLGAPIKTDSRIKSAIDLFDLTQDENFLYKNAYQFFSNNLA